MIPRTARYFNPNTIQRVAEVVAEPALDRAAGFLIRLSRGATARQVKPVTTVGPFLEAEVADRFAETEQTLRDEGYLPAGLMALLDQLESEDSATRARAANRLGWRRYRDAVDPLLAALGSAVDDVCSILDALGAIGDPRAIPILRQHADRKLLSRRRSAVEALRNLEDTDGIAAAYQLARDRLPETVRSALDHGDEKAVADAVLAVELKQRGLALDTLYEMGTAPELNAVRAVLRKLSFGQTHIWRYVKSVLKRSCLRHDHTTFGELMYLIEKQGRTSKGTTAEVKSGYDGKQRTSPIFQPNTQRFVRRAGWRYLRMLAKHRPEMYAFAAAEAILHYTPQEAPAQTAGAGCYLLHRILLGNSQRFTFKDRSLLFSFRSAKHKKAPENVREEAYPELWDAQPRAFLRLLVAARLPEVVDFAARAIATRHRNVLTSASHAEVIALLQAPHPLAVQLALEELGRRFDPEHPDWSLLQLLVTDTRPPALELGRRLLQLVAPLWTRQPERIFSFLRATDPETRALVISLTRAGIAADPALRHTLAQMLLTVLRAPEETPGAHEGPNQLVREALLPEFNALVGVTELAEWIARGTPLTQALAGDLLRHRPEALEELGIARLTELAQHSVAAVRAGMHALLRSAEALLRADPSPLFVLVESDWPDTRELAFELLRRVIDPSTGGIDPLFGLLDSNRPEVQDLGKELTTLHFAKLDPEDVVYRSAQHPHPNMRPFALDLVVKHLPDGASPLGQLRNFFRSALFDTWPERRVKRRVIDFLAERGLRDEQQAEVAAGILADVARLQGRADFERALEALVRIKLAFPEVEAAIQVRAGGEE